MKVLILKKRNNNLIKTIMKGSKQTAKPEGLYYSENTLYCTDGMRALAIDSDFFSFDEQPKENVLYEVLTTKKEKEGIYYFLNETSDSMPQFKNVFPSDDNKVELFPCQIDNDIICNNIILNIYSKIQCGLRYDFIKDLINDDNEIISVYGKNKNKPVLFEYTGSRFLVMPYKVKDVL